MFSTYETTSMASDIFLDYNYGSLEISDQKTKFKAFIRDIHGKNFIERSYSGAELSFKKSNLSNEKLCILQTDKQLYFRYILQKLDEIILEGDLDTALRFLLVIPSILILICALLLRVTELILRRCARILC